jgi:hypothetical protein
VRFRAWANIFSWFDSVRCGPIRTVEKVSDPEARSSRISGKRRQVRTA